MSIFRKFVMLGAVLLLAACDQGSSAEPGAGGPGGREQGGAAGAPPPPQVTVASPYVGPVNEWNEFSGRFEATDTVDIRSRISGYLMKVLFTDGAVVQKGDPLFIIDPRQIEATIRQKEADLNLARSQTTEATNAFNRADSLFKTGDISQAVLDQRRAAKDSANAAVDSAKAAVDSARVDLVYTKINAPIAGKISRKLVAEGNLVNPGQDVLTTIVSMDPIYFYFDVDEQTYLDYARTHPDQTKDALNIPVAVSLSDESEFTHAGVVDFVDNVINNSTGTMRARAVLENDDMVLTPGMFGRVRIQTGQRDQGIMIPDAAIMTDQSRKFVYVVGADNTAKAQTVVPGPMDKGLRVINEGLTGSETIIINGLQRAQEGAPVTPQKTELRMDPSTGQYVPPADPMAAGGPAGGPPGAAPSAPAGEAPPAADMPAEQLPPAGEQPAPEGAQ